MRDALLARLCSRRRALLAALLLLAACGKRGDLRLPEEDAPEPRP